jgi:hypothetical protein
VIDGDLAAWKARLVARETIRLSADAAAYVDRHVAPVAHKVRPGQLERLVAEAIGRFRPEELERLAAESWDKRHVTVHDQLVSFTGTMRVEAELDIADALDFDAAVAAGAEQRQGVMHVHLSEAAVLGDNPIAQLERGEALVTADHSCDGDHVRPRVDGGPTCSCNLASRSYILDGRTHMPMRLHWPVA